MKREARRIHRELTEDERSRLQQARAEVEREKPQIIERGRRIRQAVEEDTVSGQLRRAMAESELRTEELAEQVGIDRQSLADFMAGDSTLDSDTLSRIAALVGYELQPISADTER
ncbi:MAG: helix-turn-helix domain-containing protein [Planctomycetaceae bacterium]